MEAKVIPFLRYKKLVTYDKYEITQLRNVHNSVRSYINDKTKAKPLSICVFGAPGSGKSFTVKQITQDVDKNGKTETIHFNLSQLKGPEALRQVFHQIRDVGLKGDLPIAFFDEFDTKTEGSGTFSWLKHFLAPMEDGVFIDNGRSHIAV
jgi:predicted AAA+ superfamily ATPase